MRPLAALLAATATAALGGCASYVEQPYQPTARAQEDLRRELAGKVPGRPVDCLQSSRSGDMQVVDDNTILFKEGSRTYVQSPVGGCRPLGSGQYTLVTHSFGGMGLCRGDIARVVDLTGGFTVGSCTLNAFVPYERPRRS
jgi:hypothetical protein